MTKKEMGALLQTEFMSIQSLLDSHDYDNAVDDAERETGWTFPVLTNFRIFWAKQRAKRHLFFYLVTQATKDFKAKQFNLQHRFDHYRQLIKDLDEEYIRVQETNPEEFTTVDDYAMFGTKIDAGFSYDHMGRDITYETDNKVIINPIDDD